MDSKTAQTSPEDIIEVEDTMNDLSGTTTIVVGASRGLGRGIATAFAEAGAPVVAVSRTAAFSEPANGAGKIEPEVADAGDATVAGRLLDRYEPQAVILVAGATAHASAAAADVGDVFGQLADRCPDRVPLAARGAAQAAAARRQGGRDQQWCRAGGVAAQRRAAHPEIAGAALVELVQADAANVAPA
jgi:NAD(P)-dependent dehydrogenase (short-subunit alcohol dehydrogenase family)